LRCRKFNVAGRETSVDPVALIDASADIGAGQEDEVHEPRRYQDTDFEILKLPKSDRLDIELCIDERQSLHAPLVDIAEALRQVSA